MKPPLYLMNYAFERSKDRLNEVKSFKRKKDALASVASTDSWVLARLDGDECIVLKINMPEISAGTMLWIEKTYDNGAEMIKKWIEANRSNKK